MHWFIHQTQYYHGWCRTHREHDSFPGTDNTVTNHTGFRKNAFNNLILLPQISKHDTRRRFDTCMNLRIRKPTICICENKGADQLCSKCTADLRLCFRYPDSTISLLLISKVSSFLCSSVTVQTRLCTWLCLTIT